jgi:hypothetical protein
MSPITGEHVVMEPAAVILPVEIWRSAIQSTAYFCTVSGPTVVSPFLVADWMRDASSS